MKAYDLKKKIPALVQALGEACAWAKAGPMRFGAVNNAGIARFLLPSRLLLRAEPRPPPPELLFVMQLPRDAKALFSMADLELLSEAFEKVRPIRRLWDGMVGAYSHIRHYLVETDVDPEWEKCKERYQAGCQHHPEWGRHCTCNKWLLNFEIAMPNKHWHT